MTDEFFYSQEALLNRVLFLSDLNDINIFVEDEYKEFEYENIFNRLFSEDLVVNNIFPMKGKPGVEKAFEIYGTNYEGIPAIYIVDGDFDIIMDKKTIDHPNYIYLNKYNIESFYVDRGATIRFMAGKMKKRQKEIINIIAYDTWESDTYNKLEKLFLNYIVAQKAIPDEKNVGISPHKYIDSKGYISSIKIDRYISELREKVTNYESLYDIYKQRFQECLEGDKSRLICGKYLIASLACYLRKRTKVTFKEDDFRYYLVGEFGIRKLGFLKRKIEDILKESVQNKPI